MTEQQEQPVSAGVVTVGNRLRSAREAAGLSRGDIAARTRINERHLAAIEDDNFAALASRTYAVGFSRNYARVVGLDPAEIAEAVREQTGYADPAAEPGALDNLEPGDPSRVPTRAAAWVAGLGAFLVVIAGYYAWRTFNVPEMALPSLAADEGAEPQNGGAAAAAAAGDAVNPAGAVVFTAAAPDVWVKFYDAQGVQLMQKQMALGESYTVPADAAGPQIWTGRPEALTITIGGKPVPPLAERQMTMKDVPISASALLSRGAAPSAAGGAPSAAGAVPAAARPAALPQPRAPAPTTAMPPPPVPAIDVAQASDSAASSPDSTVSE